MNRTKIYILRIKASEALDAGNYQKTIRYCNLLLRQKSTDKHSQSVAYVMKGQVHEKLGNTRKALLNYNKALQIIGSNSRRDNRNRLVIRHGLRGRCYQALGEYAKALRDFEEMTILDDKKVSGLLESAQLYIEIENYEKAKEKLKLVLKRTKGWPNENTLRGEVDQLMQKINKHE